ncbi:hypothetical protein BCR44DRAFT_1225465 [Catenaria anguillulae PL171]|uniref:Uncharacterized protein n=1 Tax=Catenaria anguillulae PL171 TaxID=765915 RepID=A0A1Y2HID9_9FUNG|nr:hypothetical protein BCR44DRAFT_1225465 [Catenaria anguillulae PL171]
MLCHHSIINMPSTTTVQNSDSSSDSHSSSALTHLLHLFPSSPRPCVSRSNPLTSSTNRAATTRPNHVCDLQGTKSFASTHSTARDPADRPLPCTTLRCPNRPLLTFANQSTLSHGFRRQPTLCTLAGAGGQEVIRRGRPYRQSSGTQQRSARYEGNGASAACTVEEALDGHGSCTRVRRVVLRAGRCWKQWRV